MTKTENAGRKKDPEKKIAILKAAEQLFLSQGQGQISMDQIAKKAGVSKLTVYNHFGSKKELYKTIVVGKIEGQLSSELFDSLSGHKPQEELSLIAKAFLDVAFAIDSINIYRTVLADARSDDETSNMFYLSAVDNLHLKFCSYLERLEDNTYYTLNNKRWSADLFFGILTGDAYKRAMLNVKLREDQEDFDTFSHFVAEAFLKIHESNKQHEEESKDLKKKIAKLKAKVSQMSYDLAEVKKTLNEL